MFWIVSLHVSVLGLGCNFQHCIRLGVPKRVHKLMQAVVHAHILMGHVTTKSLLIAMKKWRKKIIKTMKWIYLYFSRQIKVVAVIVAFSRFFSTIMWLLLRKSFRPHNIIKGTRLGEKVGKKCCVQNRYVQNAKRDDETIKLGVFLESRRIRSISQKCTIV